MSSQQPLPSAGGGKDSAFDPDHLYASSSAIVLVPRKRVPVTRSSAVMECVVSLQDQTGVLGGLRS